MNFKNSLSCLRQDWIMKSDGINVEYCVFKGKDTTTEKLCVSRQLNSCAFFKIMEISFRALLHIVLASLF
jgi:hypothetical protein